MSKQRLRRKIVGFHRFLIAASSIEDLRSSCEEEFTVAWEKHILRMERELRAALAEREAARAALWREMEETRQLRQALGEVSGQIDCPRHDFQMWIAGAPESARAV
mmetsp:Transcript_52828/g.140468  ORF Transcript_52828/g.140468 Transcript_52828/m.140468 type:complete len:106 (+) Transcript_52828:124-441(+)